MFFDEKRLHFGMFTDCLGAWLIVPLTKGFIGLTEPSVRNIKAAWTFIDLLDKLLIGSGTMTGATDLPNLQVRK